MPNLAKILAKTLLVLSILTQPSCSTFTTNFHTIEKNQAYRSALLGETALENKIKKYNIKTVINLRGEKPEEEWYEEEKDLCEKLGIKFFSVKFKSKPSKERIENLLEVFESSDYPILMHCYGGRDRTGLASAVYLAEKGDVNKAIKHLTGLQYRVLPFETKKEQRDFFEDYLNFCENNPIDFEEWLTKYYETGLR